MHSFSLRKTIRLLISIVLLIIIGCDDGGNQSGSAIYVGNFRVTFFNAYPNDLDDWQLDYAVCDDPPRDTLVKCMGMGFFIEVLDNDKKKVKKSDIRVDARVVYHGNFDVDPGADLFEDGRGFLTGSIVSGTTGDWTHLRTDQNGELLAIVGAGDITYFTNPENPDDDSSKFIKKDEWISTLVEVEFRFKNPSGGEVTKNIHCVFLKVPNQHFWGGDGTPGIIDVCYGSLSSFSNGASSDSTDIVIDSSEEIETEVEIETQSQNVEPSGTYWLQFKYVAGEWVWVYPEASNWSPYIFYEDEDPNCYVGQPGDPNDPPNWLGEIINRCEPFKMVVESDFPGEERPDIDAILETFAYNDPNDPNNIAVHESFPITTTHWFDGEKVVYHTPWIIWVNDHRFTGTFVDSYGNEVISVYVENGWKMQVRPIEGGDFNGDRVVNLEDFDLLRARYGSSYGESGYNAAYDSDQDGAITSVDLMGVSEQWLSRY